MSSLYSIIAEAYFSSLHGYALLFVFALSSVLIISDFHTIRYQIAFASMHLLLCKLCPPLKKWKNGALSLCNGMYDFVRWWVDCAPHSLREQRLETTSQVSVHITFLHGHFSVECCFIFMLVGMFSNCQIFYSWFLPLWVHAYSA